MSGLQNLNQNGLQNQGLSEDDGSSDYNDGSSGGDDNGYNRGTQGVQGLGGLNDIGLGNLGL